MPDEDNVIDVEAEEIVESDNLPAVIPRDASNSEPIEVPNRQDTLLEDNPGRRCVARKRNGEQCRKFAIYGGTVCRTHGGATKRVKEAARIRVENASNRLMGKLIEFAFDDTKPPDVQLKAIQNSLDRAGLKPPAEVVLSQGETAPYEELFDGIGTMTRAESRRARGVPDDQDDFAGIDHAHLHASSQEGAEHQSSNPPTPQDPADPNQPDDTRLRRESLNQTTDHRDSDRDGPQQPPVRHISGMLAIEEANRANRAIGALSRELPGGHRRYPRP